MSDLVEFTSTILFFSEKALLESKWKKNGVWCAEVSYLKNLSPYPSFLLNCQVQQSPGIFFDRKMCFNPLCDTFLNKKKFDSDQYWGWKTGFCSFYKTWAEPQSWWNATNLLKISTISWVFYLFIFSEYSNQELAILWIPLVINTHFAYLCHCSSAICIEPGKKTLKT